MQAIVLFFNDDNADNKVFPYPNISKVRISIPEASNRVVCMKSVTNV